MSRNSKAHFTVDANGKGFIVGVPWDGTESGKFIARKLALRALASKKITGTIIKAEFNTHIIVPKGKQVASKFKAVLP